MNCWDNFFANAFGNLRGSFFWDVLGKFFESFSVKHLPDIFFSRVSMNPGNSFETLRIFIRVDISATIPLKISSEIHSLIPIRSDLAIHLGISLKWLLENRSKFRNSTSNYFENPFGYFFGKRLVRSFRNFIANLYENFNRNFFGNSFFNLFESFYGFLTVFRKSVRFSHVIFCSRLTFVNWFGNSSFRFLWLFCKIVISFNLLGPSYFYTAVVFVMLGLIDGVK